MNKILNSKYQTCECDIHGKGLNTINRKLVFHKKDLLLRSSNNIYVYMTYVPYLLQHGERFTFFLVALRSGLSRDRFKCQKYICNPLWPSNKRNKWES